MKKNTYTSNIRVFITTKKFKKLRKETKNLIFNGIFGFSNLLIVSFLYKNILLTTIILILLTLTLLFYYRSSILIPVFVFCMAGALAESFAVYHGVWIYTLSDVFNIPAWLFILWGNAGLFIYRTAIEFERLGLHERDKN